MAAKDSAVSERLQRVPITSSTDSPAGAGSLFEDWPTFSIFRPSLNPGFPRGFVERPPNFSSATSTEQSNEWLGASGIDFPLIHQWHVENPGFLSAPFLEEFSHEEEPHQHNAVPKVNPDAVIVPVQIVSLTDKESETESFIVEGDYTRGAFPETAEFSFAASPEGGKSFLKNQGESQCEGKVRFKAWNGADQDCFCGNSLKEGKLCVYKSKCGHIYHEECAKKWVTQRNTSTTCPICRKEIHDSK